MCAVYVYMPELDVTGNHHISPFVSIISNNLGQKSPFALIKGNRALNMLLS